MSVSTKFLCRAACLILFCLPAMSYSQSALSFDGVDDYVEVPDHPSLDLTNGFTIAAWVFLESYTEWASIVTKGGLPFDLGEGNNYTIHQSGPSGGSDFGHLRFTGSIPGLPINPYAESNTQIPLQEWHHVAVTFNGKRLRFFFDGRPDGEHVLVGTLGANDEPLHIGVDFPGGDEYWHGCIDDVIIFNRALTRDDFDDLFEGEFSLRRILAGFWRFNENSGNIAHDRSRHRNHGQLIGDPVWKTPGAPIPFFPKETAAELSENTPADFLLLPNYPNPFNPETEIRFQLPDASHVVVKIFNTLGEEIRTLVDVPYQAGYHGVRWDGKDKNNKPVASGVYQYQLRAGSFVQVRKMSLLR